MKTAHRQNVKRDWHYTDCAPGAERARYVDLRGAGMTTNAAWYAARSEYAPTRSMAEFWLSLLEEHHAAEFATYVDSL